MVVLVLKNMEKPSFFAVIPADVRYDAKLKPMARLLYGEITALCNKQGHCWAQNEYFSELYERDKTTISRWISQLQKQGYIDVSIDKKRGNVRTIKLLANKSIPIDENDNRVIAKMTIPIDENANSYKENNTINNTINNREGDKALAIDFLKEKFPIRFEQEFRMRYEKKIDDLDHFFENYESVVEDEEIPYGPKLLTRLGRYARAWIKNQKNNDNGTKSSKNEQRIGRQTIGEIQQNTTGW